MTANLTYFDMARLIGKINNDFHTQRNNWCDIKNFQFTNGYYSEYANTKHYDKIHMEQYYLLKFLPFYIEEAKEAYVKFFSTYNKPSLKILSIGVGSGVDYIALKQVVKSKGLKIDLDYTGVDIVNWKYRNSSINFIQGDILTIDKSVFENVDLIVFPKSLIELDDKRLKHISKMITELSAKNIYFLNTYVKRESEVSGIDEFRQIHRHLMRDGYRLETNNLTEYYTVKNNEKISYPISYNLWRKPLYAYCNRRCSGNKVEKCSLSQYPMIYKKNMAFNVLKYTKEQ